MKRETIAVVRRGIECAIVASVPQVILPKLQELLWFREHESADLGPHFIARLAQRFEQPLPEDMKWLAASAFHFGYAMWWGAAYALVQRRLQLHPLVGGLALATTIYLITFPKWGGAVVIGSEPPPRKRSWRVEIAFATAPLVFGFVTALLFRHGPERRRW